MVYSEIDRLYRQDFRRLFATLVKLLKDFDLAEDALQEAFTIAMQQWPTDGIPANPTAWLISTARFKAIDRLRKQSRLAFGQEEYLENLAHDAASPEQQLETGREIEDDRLRLIFTCCHPAIAVEVQIALTLREVCGLSTEAIAAAFLVQPATMAQRLVRGKNKIRAAGIPYAVPMQEHLAERLESVLSVIYLVYNEGYHASSGAELTRPDLASEAIRLARLLLTLLPDTEVLGLLALMLLNESRRSARSSAEGEIILLEHQNRALWNRGQIAEGKALLVRALEARELGSYTLQAAISAVHADASTAAHTDWQQIVALYQLLLRANPSPVVELNRAVAVAMSSGADKGLVLVNALLQGGKLEQYHLAHAAQADLHRRLGNREAARAAYQRALALTQQEPERRFLQQRIEELAAC